MAEPEREAQHLRDSSSSIPKVEPHSPLPFENLSGFVLAGGRSSRMGQEKSLLFLAGEPLISHALRKLKKLCAEVSILSSNPALAPFGPLVPDLHPDCGPISGVEAALSTANHDWSLILPVDVPFVSESFLRGWISQALTAHARLAVFVVDGRPQPTLILIHRDLAPGLAEAVRLGRYKLYPELVAAATLLGPAALLETQIKADQPEAAYFANLNTPADFAAAEQLAWKLPVGDGG